MGKRYACAHAVLPRDLVDAIQAHFTGLLWVPNGKQFYAERKNLVLALKDEGVPIKEIARLAEVSPRRVYQILQETKDEEDSTDNPVSAPVSNQPKGVSARGSEIRLNSDFTPGSETSVQNSHDDE